MRKLFFFLAAAFVSTVAMAETAKVNPTWEGNYRTNNATPTGWTKVTTTDEQFEVKNQARFFAVQTWVIADIDQVDSLEFMYQRVSGQTNDGILSMWLFPYNSMVSSTADYSTAGVAFLNDVQSVLGVMPGNEIVNAPFKVSASVDTLNAHFRMVALGAAEIEALKAAGSVSNNYLTVNVLLCTYQANGDYANEMNYKFYHTGDAASYCTVHYQGQVTVPAIVNNTTFAGYADLATAVDEATAGDVLTLNEDVTISESRMEIKKELTIQGATGAERIICDVPVNQLMVLANGNEANYTVTFKNFIVDGQNIERSIQTFDSNNKAKMAFENVSIINTTYSVVTGDIKANGREVVLSGANSFPTGIYLNRGKRVDNQNTTHTNPIRIILAGDYEEDYAIVLHCSDSTLYTAVDAADTTDWELYVAKSGTNQELKGRRVAKPGTGIDNTAVETKAVKVLRNGQIYIRRGEQLFDLTGRAL